MAFKKTGIQAQLLTPLMLTLVLLVGGFIATIFSIQKFNLESSTEQLIRAASGSFETDLKEQQELLSSLENSIVIDPLNLALLENEDRQGLLERNQELFKHLKSVHSVTHFYFHSVEGINIVRIHHPQRFGDSIKRFTMQTALRTGEPNWGIELGPLGIFTLRVVSPVIKDGNLIGYLELGKEIEDVIQKIEDNHQVLAIVLIDKAFLSRKTWESGMAILSRQADWNLLDKHAISYPSISKLSLPIQELVKDISQGLSIEKIEHFTHGHQHKKTEIYDLDGEPFLSAQIPLVDASGSYVGELIMLKSNLEHDEKVNDLILASIVIALIISSALLIFLKIVLAKADYYLDKSHIKLIESQNQLNEAQRIAKLGGWLLDHTNKKLVWSAETYRIYGVDIESFELSLDSVSTLIHPEDKEKVRKAFEYSIQNKTEYQFIHRIVIPSTSVKHVHERCETEFDEKGTPLISRGTVQDITEMVEAEKALYESEQKHRALLNNTTSVIYMKDLQGRYLFVNRMFEELFNVRTDEIEGKTDFDIFPSQMAIAFRENDQKVIESAESIEAEEIAPHEDGEHTYLSVKFPFFDQSGDIQAVCGISTDITERIRAEEKVLHQAHYDALTDLPNRFLVLDRLGQLINESKRTNALVAVVFLDLDDFKKINDSMGHEAGDKLLIEAAKRLSKVVRLGDTVGRLGGDEFIVLLNNLSSATDARPVVENLLRRFREPFLIDDRELILTTTVGIAVHPSDGETPSELLRNADSAMYHAKDSGRNTYSFFTGSMNKGISRRLEVEEQLHGALDRNELQVHYQSQIAVKSGDTVGCEALLRWRSEKLGNIPPDEFISIAEQTGDIVPIGKFVLRETLKMLTQIKSETGSYIRVAVNLSPRQFRDPGLVDFVYECLKEFDISGKYLELEITEGVLLSGHSYIREALDKLESFGIVLTMDDFGTGYSSLSYLRKYPFKVLKIDRSFIGDLIVDPENTELVNATIAMSHALGLEVVAEGVETIEQYQMLNSFGCDYAQGYYFAHPVNKEIFIASYINNGTE